jgi:hypothetical protein
MNNSFNNMTQKTLVFSCLFSFISLGFFGQQAFAAHLTAPKHIAVIDAGSSQSTQFKDLAPA